MRRRVTFEFVLGWRGPAPPNPKPEAAPKHQNRANFFLWKTPCFSKDKRSPFGGRKTAPVLNGLLGIKTFPQAGVSKNGPQMADAYSVKSFGRGGGFFSPPGRDAGQPWQGAWARGSTDSAWLSSLGFLRSATLAQHRTYRCVNVYPSRHQDTN